MKCKQLLIVVLMLVVVVSRDLIAGPTVIRDNRVKDTGLTPVLGRGYTIVTNTFQSQCMENVITTEPSYDFQYKFESIEDASKISKALSNTTNSDISYGFVQGTINSHVETSSDVEEFSHHVLVELNVDTYYASVDEARTKLGQTAANLLRNKDIPGFFSSCGSYYVRSLGRNAKFISIFTYKTKTSKKDRKFEIKLKAEVQGFGKLLGASGSIDTTTSGSFASEASSKKLTIVTRAWGLSKNEGATLISYDLPTFKAAIKDAFLSMQNPITGKVVNMEVVPWVENTEFQDLIKLETEVMGPENKPVPLYRKKAILNLNAEFLAEIEKSHRNMLNIYYKSKICQQQIDADWMGGDGNYIGGFETIKTRNNRVPAETMSLKELREQLLSAAAINKLFEEQDKFMNGTDGAKPCIEEMLKDTNLFSKSYRDIPQCNTLRAKLSAVIGKKIDDYCLPNEVTSEPPKPESPTPPATQ